MVGKELMIVRVSIEAALDVCTCPFRRCMPLDYLIRNYEYLSRVSLFTDALYQVESPKRRNYCNRPCSKGGFKRLPPARMKYRSVLGYRLPPAN